LTTNEKTPHKIRLEVGNLWGVTRGIRRNYNYGTSLGTMKALRIVAIAAVALALVGLTLVADDVGVRGYSRKDGTYVPPHYRTAPDGQFYNNWSTYGNVNPYTGEFGRKLYPSSKKPHDLVPSFTLPAPPSPQFTGLARPSPQRIASPDTRVPSQPPPSKPRDTGETSGSDFVDGAQTYEVTNSDFVNMREGPGVLYRVNQRLQKGVDGIILIRRFVFNGTTKWQQVNSRGVIGWVNAYYLRK
jgi:hypothetical protein